MPVSEEDEEFGEFLEAIDNSALESLVKQIATNLLDATGCETIEDSRANLKELRKAAFEIISCITEDGEIA